MGKSHITYEQLHKLVSYGIFAMRFKGKQVSDERLSKCKKIKDADYQGIYTGSPGRDVFHMLPHLNDEQFDEIATLLADKFPKEPPGNHVNVGACVRFLYGQLEKKGILKSDNDFERMKREKLDWELSQRFVDLLYGKLSDRNNYYGMSILCEMKAHRIGDKAVIEKDSKKLDEMEELYKKSVEYAYLCNSYKQMFTPQYWAFRYFEKAEDKRAMEYAILTIKQAHKHCPDARQGYFTKLKDCLKYIWANDGGRWKKMVKKYTNSKNSCVKKVFKKFRQQVKRGDYK